MCLQKALSPSPHSLHLGLGSPCLPSGLLKYLRCWSPHLQPCPPGQPSPAGMSITKTDPVASYTVSSGRATGLTRSIPFSQPHGLPVSALVTLHSKPSTHLPALPPSHKLVSLQGNAPSSPMRILANSYSSFKIQLQPHILCDAVSNPFMIIIGCRSKVPSLSCTLESPGEL